MNRKEFLRNLIGYTLGAVLISKLSSCNDNHEVKSLTVNSEKCSGCKNCLQVRGCNAIYMKDNKAYIDKDLCHGCRKCVRYCERNAISF